MSKCCENKDPERVNLVGGQAVLEGVMMKAGNNVVTSCRKPDGTISVVDTKFLSVRKKHKVLNIPILRGVVNFFEMMSLSVKTLNSSAEALGIEEEESKFEKWLKKHFGLGIMNVVMGVSVVLGLALSLFLFMFLPIWIADGIDWLVVKFISDAGMNSTLKAVIEGVLKIVIFLSYLSLATLMPDIKRTFMYHGAEHKSIACFEAHDELTPEHAAQHTRFHPRCGTSFMFLMILLGIFAGIFVRNIFPTFNSFAVFGVRLLIFPLVMGIGYEILMFAGKHDNWFTRIVSAPGLWVQRITTKEPTLDMLECAITSLKCALRDKFPEFEEFYENEGWKSEEEKAKEKVTEEGTAENEVSTDDSDSKNNSADVESDNTDLPENTVPVTPDSEKEESKDETQAAFENNETTGILHPNEKGELLTPPHYFAQ